MARLALIILIVLLVFGALLGGGWMSTHSVVQPGQIFFFLQRFTEQVHTILTLRSIDKLTYLLGVLDWRTDDMIRTTGKPTEIQSLAAFNQVLDEMALTASVVDYHDRPSINLEIKQRIENIRRSLAGFIIVPAQNPDAYKVMQVKLNSLERVLNSEGLSTTNVNRIVGVLVPIPAAVLSKYPGVIDPAGNPTFIQRLLVPFPKDPKGVFHTFFPWEGTHITLKCDSCHNGQGYGKIPSECNACHAQIIPAQHYISGCSTCHAPTAWKDGYFNHANPDQLDCQSCHEPVRPPGHAVGQCSTCHQPGGDWKSGSYNHPNPQSLDCKSCHEKIRPANHYPLQCSNCHQPGSGWKGASFNHADPAKLDCQSCHAAARPANHFAGQCSTCHTAGTAWKPAHFNHAAADATNCIGCHAGTAPGGHYSFQCSICHSPGSWQGAVFNHPFIMNHNGAGGQCQKCHPAETPATDCRSCHETAAGGGD